MTKEEVIKQLEEDAIEPNCYPIISLEEAIYYIKQIYPTCACCGKPLKRKVFCSEKCRSKSDL